MHDRLGDLRTDAAQYAIGTHQPRSRDRLDQVLCHQRIDRGHAGDVDDGDLRTRGDDALQQALHDDLRARTIEGADERQRQDAVPQRDHGGRQFQQFLLLAVDHLLAGSRVALHGIEAQLVDQATGDPGLAGKSVSVRAELTAQ